MRLRLALAASLLAGLLATGAAAEERIRIQVRAPSERDYQVAVQRFAVEGAAAPQLEEDFGEALGRALEYSGFLRVVDPGAFLGPVRTENWDAPLIACDLWAPIGADALVQGRLEPEGSRLRARFRVWDTARCQLQGKAAHFEGPADAPEFLARRIADEVVQRFTGVRGVAATQIAFVSDRSGSKEIYLMEADGSRKRAVTDNGSINLFPSWSPDGDALAYTSYRSGSPEVWLISRGGRSNGRLLSLRADKYRAVWAPRDGRLALVMHRRQNTDLHLVGENGRGLRRLTSQSSIETSPTWSPDGRRLAFVSDRSGSPQIWLLDLATGATRRLTYEGAYNASPAWSPTGEWIVYAGRLDGNFDLYLIDPETGVRAPLVVHPRSDEEPAWSADGRKVVFTSSRYGRREILTIDLDGRNLRRLTEDFGNCSGAAWSPWLD